MKPGLWVRHQGTRLALTIEPLASALFPQERAAARLAKWEGGRKQRYFPESWGLNKPIEGLGPAVSCVESRSHCLPCVASVQARQAPLSEQRPLKLSWLGLWKL